MISLLLIMHGRIKQGYLSPHIKQDFPSYIFCYPNAIIFAAILNEFNNCCKYIENNMELNFGRVKCSKNRRRRALMQTSFRKKREFPIFTGLKISKAEIIIFRFTMIEKHSIVKVAENLYTVFSNLDITVNALLMPKAKTITNKKIKKDNWEIILWFIFSNVARRLLVSFKICIPFVFIAIHVK